MENNWASDFYKMQFGLIGNYGQEFYQEAAKEILEQIGKPIESILELGAADGSLARALSDHANHITTVELVEEMTVKAKGLNPENINTIQGSFYDVELPQTFDTVLYIDGFGVGTDKDQLKLLKNINEWLDEDGCALIDIYQPEHWKKAHNIEMYPDPKNMPHIKRRYSYNFEEDIMMDTWWHGNNQELKRTQYLKCYTSEAIHELCKQAGLGIAGYFPNGAMDYKTMTYSENASLGECLSYRIKLTK